MMQRAIDIHFVFQAVNHLFICLLFLYVFVKARDLKPENLIRSVKMFALLYLVSFGLHFGFMSLYKTNVILCFVYPFWVFFLHVPPLVFLGYFLTRLAKSHPLQPPDKDKLLILFKKHKISEREREIIGLILKGKSNQEIEDELFISMPTVKSHVYNIYKKLGIKSRYQLINLVQNRTNNR